MCCSVADGQWSTDYYCFTEWFCRRRCDMRWFAACVSAIKLEETTHLFLFGCCHHVLCRYAAATAAVIVYVGKSNICKKTVVVVLFIFW